MKLPNSQYRLDQIIAQTWNTYLIIAIWTYLHITNTKLEKEFLNSRLESAWVLYRQKFSVLSFLMGQNPKWLRRVLLPPPSPVLTNIHAILAYDVPDTENVGPPIKFRLIVGPALQPIAGSMPVNHLRRWPNTNLSPGLLYTLRKHVAFNQCWPTVFDAGPSLKQHWLIVEPFLIAELYWWPLKSRR